MRTIGCLDALRNALRIPFSIRSCFPVLLALAIGLSGAEVTATGVQVGQDLPTTETPAQKPLKVHRSPRAVLNAFTDGIRQYHDIKSYRDEDLALALSCFQQGDEPKSASKLEALAIQFYEVLIRLNQENLERDGEFDGDTFIWSIQPESDFAFGDGTSESLGRVVFVRIQPAHDDQPANWRFAPSLLDEIPALHEFWKDEPVRRDYAEGLAEASKSLPLLERLAFSLREVMPSALRQRGFLLEHWQWLGLGLLAIVGVLLGRIVNFILRLLSQRAAKSERLEINKSVLDGFERPFSLFVMAWIVFLMLPAIYLEPRIFKIVRLAVALFLAVAGVWSAYRLVDVGAAILSSKASKTDNRFDDMLVPLVRRMAKIFLTFVGIIYVASYISEDLYGIVAGLSIGSLAVGFAAKDSIENLFGTITVLLDKPFQLGDWITVGEIDGSVEAVGFRSTKVRTFYNSLISVPNSAFISAHIDNWGERRYRRIRTMVGLAYDTPPLKIESFCEALRELIRTHPYTRKDYYHIYLNQLGPSSLDVLVYCFVETPDWSTELREKHRLYLDILRVAEGLGIEIAFPTQTLHVHTDQDDGPPAGPQPPQDSRGAERMGRELANLIVKEGLEEYGGEKPPPVQIN